MKTEGKIEIKKVVQQFINHANKFEADEVVALFAANAVIDDVSVGEKFRNKEGVRRYFDTYFIGYKTVTKLDSIKVIDPNYAEVKVDFKGNFGHEKGGLNVKLNDAGLIVSIDAFLE